MATIVKTSSDTRKALIRKTGWPAPAKTFTTKRNAEDWGASHVRCVNQHTRCIALRTLRVSGPTRKEEFRPPKADRPLRRPKAALS
ncbi:hypothetical protein D3C71_1632530 [compost metagenome]